MPASLQSYRSFEHGDGQYEGHDDDNHNNNDEDYSSSRPPTAPTSPTFRRSRSYRTADERSSLLENPDHRRLYLSRTSSIPGTPRTLAALGRQVSYGGSIRINRNHSRSGSLGQGFQARLVGALDRSRNNQIDQCKSR